MHKRRLHVLIDLVKRYNIKSVLEIGILRAETASNVLKSYPELKYVGVDSYTNFESLPSYDHDNNIGIARKVFEKYKNAELRIMTSDEAYDKGDECFDLIFIDGDHSYEAVKNDISKWITRCNVILAGHDFSPYHPGVIRALTDLNLNDKLHIESDNVWWIKNA